MKTHPSERDLALFAGGDCSVLSRFRLDRHIRRCAQCEQTVVEFLGLRSELAEDDLPADIDWNRLSAEMRANIHLGLEAGKCVRPARMEWRWNPRMALAFASLMLLIGANFVLKSPHPETAARGLSSEPILESTGSGIELRTGAGSFALLNHRGAAADQTVSAQGEIRARSIDGETGAVTITNVYLQ